MVETESSFPEVRQSFWNYAFLIMSNIVGTALSLVLMTSRTRMLGAEGFAVFNVFMMVANAFFLLSVNWTNTGLLRFGKEAFVRDGRINEVFWTRNLIVGIVFLCCAPVFIVFRSFLIRYTHISPADYYLIPLFVFLLTLSELYKFTFQAVGNLKLYAVQMLLEKFLTVGLALGFYFVNHGVSVVQMIYCHAAGFFVSATITGSRLPLRYIFPIRVSKAFFKTFFLFSFPMVVAAITTYLYNWLDVAVIKHYKVLYEVGVYSLAYTVMVFVQQFIGLLVPVTLQFILAFHAKGREDLLRRYMDRIVPQCVFFTSFGVSLIVAFGCRAAPYLFGESFSPAVRPMEILMVGAAFNALSVFNTGMVYAYMLIGRAQIFMPLIMMVNLGLDMLLVPRFGSIGAAVAAVCTQIGLMLVYAVYLNRPLKTFRFKQVAPPFMVFAALIPQLLIPGFAASSICSTAALFIFAFAMLRGLVLFRPDDAQFLTQITMPPAARRILTSAIMFLSRICGAGPNQQSTDGAS